MSPGTGVNPTTAPTDWWSMEGLFGNAQTGVGGWAMPAIGLANSLMNGWFGMEKLDVAKSQLKENKRQFNLNFGSQAALTNSRLADRQNRRMEEGRARMGTDQYLSNYGVKY